MEQDGLPPLFEQIRRRILDEIESGALREGMFLAPEPELCARYGVSRVTLRRAVGELCQDGLLIRQQGRGTLVAPRKMQQRISLSGFAEAVEGMGHEAGHVILRQDAQPPPGGEAGKLPAAEPVRFLRLLELDGRPMTLETLWFDAARFPGAVVPVSRGESFFAALRRAHATVPAAAERLIDVGIARADEARSLGISTSQPVYRIEKLLLDGSGDALALSHLITPCHLVTFSLHTGVAGEAKGKKTAS